MKKVFYTSISAVGLLLFSFTAKSQQSVGIGTIAPDASARLEVAATNKGLLVPRVNLSSLTDNVTISTPATSLLVYNTNATVGTGYYFNSGTPASPVWKKLLNTGDAGGGSTAAWSLTGNAGTNIDNNFLGTTDSVALRFRVHNAVVGHLSRDNVFFGDSSGVATDESIGVFNVGIGTAAMISNDTGSINVAIGGLAMLSSTSDQASVGIGFLALSNSDDYYGGGNLNTAVGSFSLENSIDAYYNTAVGALTLDALESGVSNVAVGNFTLENSDADENTGVGFAALEGATFNGQNTAVGAFALQTLTSGSKNTAIGDSADVNVGTLTNSTAIGYKAKVLTSNTIVLGNASITALRCNATLSTLSDGRFKKEVKEDVSGLDFIKALRPVTYLYDYNKMEDWNNSIGSTKIKEFGIHAPAKPNFKDRKNNALQNSPQILALKNSARTKEFSTVKNKSQRSMPAVATEETLKQQSVRHTGFIAQEVNAAAKKVGYDFSGVDIPNSPNEQYALRYSEFVVPLVKAVQEQQVMIETLQKQNENLAKRLEILEHK